jgi:hypothetical protein
MIAEVLAAYGSEVAPHKASARNIGYNITNLLKWWGDKTVRDLAQDLPLLYRDQDEAGGRRGPEGSEGCRQALAQGIWPAGRCAAV